ncbi:MAG: O-antigen ligase family protein [Burkholderiales bacterium]|jgi:hypothetical protein|nr:O-antigen ligase family protein [Burkholderiales bacterium]
MPVHLRALVVLLIFGVVVFALSRRAATEFAVDHSDFNRRRNLWFIITAVAFVSHSFWLFIFVAAMTILVMRREESNPLAMYAVVMFAVPLISSPVPGLGVFNQLLEFDYTRLLSLVLLLPAYLHARREVKSHGEGWAIADFCLLSYVLVQLGLRLQLDTLTNTLRYALYAVIDVGLPYYVASRSLRSARAYRDVFMSFCLASLVLGLVACFEAVKYWLLYGDLIHAWGLHWSYSNYLGRSALLRAQGPTGQPIVLGCIFVVAIALFLAMQRYVVQNRRIWWLGLFLLFGGLISTVSRGPWVAALATLTVFKLTGPKAVGGLFKSGLVLGAIVGLVMMSPMRDTVVDLLPFIGTVEAENVVYRQRMLESSIQIILQNPWFGSTDYVSELIAMDLVIGGMVDIVNTYVGIGLANGLVGLFSFMGVFILGGISVFWNMMRLPDPECEERTIGQALLASLVGIAVSIGTVSSITFIPLLYWFVAGLCVGYSFMVKRTLDTMSAPVERPVDLPQGFRAAPKSRPT